MNKLTNHEISTRLALMQGWKLIGQSIEKEFEFSDFKAAMVFVNRIAVVAEELKHHPDWSNSHNKVHISLTSHDAGGITEKDFSFALESDKASKYQKQQ